MTLIEQLNAVIIAIAEDISNNIGNSGNSDNSALLPRKIGSNWYQSGLRHGAEYPYPCALSVAATTNGA